jgi:hypothetical protein
MCGGFLLLKIRIITVNLPFNVQEIIQNIYQAYKTEEGIQGRGNHPETIT